MNSKQQRRVVVWGILGTFLCGFLLLSHFKQPEPPDIGKEAKPPNQSAPAVTKIHLQPVPRSPSFGERLDLLGGSDTPAAASERAAVLLEWLATDRRAAIEFMAQTRFIDFWRAPGVCQAVGEKATPAELLEIANGSETPYDAITVVGKWASPAVVNDLANLLPSVNARAAGPTAQAVGTLLATLNVDRAIAFAMGQANDEVRSFAIGGVFAELSSAPDGEPQIRSLYGALPPAIRNSDPVLAAYGVAIGGSDPVAALEDLQSMTSSPMRTNALLALAKNTASSSPETAIAAIYGTGLSEEGIDQHVRRILQDWSAVDPNAVAQFLATTVVIPGNDLPKYRATFGPPKG